MATPDEPVRTPDPKKPVVEFLRRYLEMAEKGELQSVVLGFVKTDGGAAVQSTPISAVMMNHLSMLLQIRVQRAYREAMAQATAPAPSTGARGVPEKARTEAILPRKVRREVQRNLQRLTKKKAKKKQAAAQVLKRVPGAVREVYNPATDTTTPQNGTTK